MPSRPLIVFDVNETLLDLDAVRPVFERVFGDPGAVRMWFAELVTYSEALTLAGVYVPFTDVGAAVLRMIAEIRGVALTDADGAELAAGFASMPAHADVAPALRRLRDHEFRLFTLTNNPLETSTRQLEQTGLSELFERRFSVETVRRHKPAPEVYAHVADELAVEPGDICLVACHTWDTLGAVAAGWQAALVLRPGNAPLGVGPQPLFVGDDLTQVAERLIAAYGGGREL